MLNNTNTSLLAFKEHSASSTSWWWLANLFKSDMLILNFTQTYQLIWVHGLVTPLRLCYMQHWQRVAWTGLNDRFWNRAGWLTHAEKHLGTIFCVNCEEQSKYIWTFAFRDRKQVSWAYGTFVQQYTDRTEEKQFVVFSIIVSFTLRGLQCFLTYLPEELCASQSSLDRWTYRRFL